MGTPALKSLSQEQCLSCWQAETSFSLVESSSGYGMIGLWSAKQVKGTQMTNSPPESLLLLDTPTAASGPSKPLDDDSSPLGALFLHAGLANGVLVRSEVCLSMTWHPSLLHAPCLPQGKHCGFCWARQDLGEGWTKVSMSIRKCCCPCHWHHRALLHALPTYSSLPTLCATTIPARPTWAKLCLQLRFLAPDSPALPFLPCTPPSAGHTSTGIPMCVPTECEWGT